MKVVQVVFSPAGGTQKVVDALTAGWEMPVERLDLTDAGMDAAKAEFQEEDVALLAVPSYGGRVPALAAQRLARLKGNQARCVLVCVYGNRAYEDTLAELQDIAGQCGFRLSSAVAAVAEHSIMHQYAAGRPDQKDAEELQDFGRKILAKLEDNGRTAVIPEIPGNRPYKKAGGAGLVPRATGKCVQCGQCAENCPAQAISRENLKKADSKACISCMRCVTQCPQSARKVNEAMVSVVALAIKKACSVRKGNELFI